MSLHAQTQSSAVIAGAGVADESARVLPNIGCGTASDEQVDQAFMHKPTASDAIPGQRALLMLEANYPSWFFKFESTGGVFSPMEDLEEASKTAPDHVVAAFMAGIMLVRRGEMQ